MTQAPEPGTVPTWELSDRLRKARSLTGLDQKAFAAEIGISPRSVTNYEKGFTLPGKPVLVVWSMRTGVPVEWLATGQGAGSVDPNGGERARQDLNLRPLDYMGADQTPVIPIERRRTRRLIGIPVHLPRRRIGDPIAA